MLPVEVLPAKFSPILPVRSVCSFALWIQPCSCGVENSNSPHTNTPSPSPTKNQKIQRSFKRHFPETKPPKVALAGLDNTQTQPTRATERGAPLRPRVPLHSTRHFAKMQTHSRPVNACAPYGGFPGLLSCGFATPKPLRVGLPCHGQMG